MCCWKSSISHLSASPTRTTNTLLWTHNKGLTLPPLRFGYALRRILPTGSNIMTSKTGRPPYLCAEELASVGMNPTPAAAAENTNVAVAADLPEHPPPADVESHRRLHGPGCLLRRLLLIPARLLYCHLARVPVRIVAVMRPFSSVDPILRLPRDLAYWP